MLKTKCIRAEPQSSDGLRISIMSRHTLRDGVTPDPTITYENYDVWWPELAPPAKLIGDYYKRDLPWEAFAEGFKAHLETAAAQTKLERLGLICLKSNATILCTEETPEFCHRRLVAEKCSQLIPELLIVLQ